MNSKRAFFMMVGAIVLLAGLAVGGAVLGNILLQKKADQLMSLKLDNLVLENQQTSLLQAKKDIDKYSSLEQIAKVIVPQEKDQAQTVREIINLASASGIKISTISFPTSTLGQTPVKTTPASGSAATPAVTTPPITQVKPVDNIPGLYQMEINVQSDVNSPVPYSQLLDFLTRLEQNRHTAQVSSINVSPAPKTRGLVTFSVVVNVFIKP